MGFDREGQHAVRCENSGDTGNDRRKIVDIDKDVCGEDEFVFPASGIRQKIFDLGDVRLVIDALLVRLGNHGGRQIDADESIDKWTKRFTSQTCATAEIKRAREMKRPAALAHGAFYRLTQNRRAAIVQMLG